MNAILWAVIRASLLLAGLAFWKMSKDFADQLGKSSEMSFESQSTMIFYLLFSAALFAVAMYRTGEKE